VKRIVIATIGEKGAGKSVVESVLVEHGFKSFSLGDVTREIAKKRKIAPTTKNLQDIGNEMRKEWGSDYLAREVSLLFDNEHRVLVDGVRNPGEAEFLKDNYGAHIIGVTADPVTREEHVLKRARVGDPTSHEEFDKVERRDRGEGEPDYGQQVEKTMALADIIIQNRGSKTDLKNEILRTIKAWGIEGIAQHPESE